MAAKTKQLQIRLTASEKRLIEDSARRANLDISKWVLGKLLPKPQQDFQNLTNQLAKTDKPKYVLAEIHDFLSRQKVNELKKAIRTAPDAKLSEYYLNYLAAMVEEIATKKNIPVPEWTNKVSPLRDPIFGSQLKGLRLHLLTHSPISFRRRNIFIDSTIGDRV